PTPDTSTDFKSPTSSYFGPNSSPSSMKHEYEYDGDCDGDDGPPSPSSMSTETAVDAPPHHTA
ncbi:hypothetical protein EV182_004568, partial [Spiromyces aspiralis]